MKQLPRKSQKLKVKPMKISETKLLSSTEVYSSNVMYVDGAPYIKLKKTSIAINKSERKQSRSFDLVEFNQLQSFDEDDKGIHDNLCNCEVHRAIQYSRIFRTVIATNKIDI